LGERRGGWIIALAIVALGVLHLATLRPGQDWGDDFAQYVAHARNLVEHRAYDQTGYVANPDCPTHAPRAYPPLLPLMLAPIVGVAGLDFEPMKWLMVGFLVLGLGAIELVLRRGLAWPARLGIVLLLGLNPYVYQFKNSILSDLPFLFFVYAALAWSAHLEDRRGRWWTGAIVLGVLLELAWATRMVGLVLPAALVLRDLLRYRRIARTTLAALGVFVLLALAQAAVFPPSGDYAAMLALDATAPGLLAGVALAHARGYAFMLVQLWSVRRVPWLGEAMLILAVVLALRGYARAWKRGATGLECFPPLYLLVVLIWPVPQDLRFLLPVLPAFFYYAAAGLGAEAARQGRRWIAYGAGAALLLTGLVSATAGDFAAPRGPFDDGSTGLEARALFDHIIGDAHIGPRDLFAADKPRALALFTQRPVMPYAPPTDWRQFRERLEQLHVRYLVVGTGQNLGSRDKLWWQKWHGPGTKVIFHNDRYALLRLTTINEPVPSH
jgi:hypothetical protein